MQLRHNLKTRITVCLTLLSIAVVLLLGIFQLRLIRSEMTEGLANQQFSLISKVADDIDQKLLLNEALLGSAGALLSRQLARGPVDYTAFLVERPALATIFDYVFVFSPEGRIVGDYPHKPERIGVDISDRPYFTDTISTGKPVVSQPYLARQVLTPQVMITMPVHDAQGKIVAVLGGSFNLLNRNMLGTLGETRVGKTGHLYLMTQDGVVVAHPDKRRIMKKVRVDPSQPDGVMNKALTGFEGSVEGDNAPGVPVLASFKHLKVVNWITVAILPAEEALEPIRLAQWRLLMSILVASVVIAVGVWLLLRWLLSPLMRLRDGIERQQAQPHSFEPIVLPGDDEVSAVAHAFNALMVERARTLGALHAEKERLLITLHSIGDPVITTDANGWIEYLNPAAERLTGWRMSDAHGASFDIVFNLISEETDQPVVSPIEQALKANRPVSMHTQCLLRRRDGTMVAIDDSAAPIHDANGKVVGVVLVMQDVTRQRQLANKAKWEAYHDALTGLSNRRDFEEQLASAVVRSQQRNIPSALLLIDLDHFKPVNDLGGHAAGDALLMQIAALMPRFVRDRDVVARLGGDEFAILLNHCEVAKAAGVAQKVRIAIAALEFEWEGRSYWVSASIGIAQVGSDLDHISETLRQADEACYDAKAAGRNCVVIYEGTPLPLLNAAGSEESSPH
ncbi:putative diguanylate cyclase YegE [Andreprevotia sp. IGB-42]|uniref:diguanylate cyclase domain-containing protein n=1 Tax=Andreprevotia sp. IGB-42 TaxID=2497473 RepID=UPI0013590F20|nr:diguanylate cyclase [Andreprevotia sp. IGB-42]KAF0811274.1 putative diguanylate cyclase YegE [Andreprevotia sp. IGB-42]